MHLLERLLAFDPERRCSAEEALQHEYFAHLDRSMVHETSECMPMLVFLGVSYLMLLS